MIRVHDKIDTAFDWEQRHIEEKRFKTNASGR